MIAVLVWILQTFLTTAVLILVVFCLCKFFRNRPSVQHALWLVVMLKFVTPPLVSLPVETASLNFASQKTTEQFFDTTMIDPVIRSDVYGATDRNLSKSVSGLKPIVAPTSDLTNVTEHSGWHWLSGFVLAAWFVGIITNLNRQLCLIRSQAAVLAKSVEAPFELQSVVAEVASQMNVVPVPTRIVAGITSPFIWCLGEPQLIWPANMASGSSNPLCRAIIAHELSHIRRMDHWVAWIDMIASVLWWWNPLFRLAQRNLHVTSEMACDALALATYPDERSVYAETLFALSVSKTGAPALRLAVGTGTPSSLERRISMMMSDQVSGKLSLTGVFIFAALATVALPTISLAQNGTAKVQSEATVAQRKSSAVVGNGRAALTQNMKRILEALHNYHDTFGAFPPSVIIDTESTTPRSWRVELLPFLDQGALYDQYKRNEPWNSELNKKVLAQMPSVYGYSDQATQTSLTTVVTAFGRGLVFDLPDETRGTQARGVSLASMLDGSSFTVAILEASTEIPWTKPEDIEIDLSKSKLPEFGIDDVDFLAGFADGSVATFSRTIELPVFKAYLTPRGQDADELKADKFYIQKMSEALRADKSIRLNATPSLSR